MRVSIYGEEKITDVVGDIDSKAHVSEVKAVAEPDQCECNNVVPNQLLKILAWFLKLKKQNNGLLRPVRCLKQIVRLEESLVASMRKPLEHGSCFEVPYWGATHNV